VDHSPKLLPSCAHTIYVHTPQEELLERVLELINDARVAWPIEKFVEGVQREGGGGGVWRYVFDQEGSTRGISHHAADLIYLFDNVPSITSISQSLSISSDDSSDSFDHHVQSHVHIHYEEEEEWALPIVDSFTFSRIRDTIQERWISFSYGESPWNDNKVFVFGPEGEIGERSGCIFDGRRRTKVWREVLEPLGLRIVQKVGVELSNGPPIHAC